MFLTKSMILTIILSLSNGAEIRYELSSSTYTFRSTIKNEDGRIRDELQIMRNSDNKVYTFNLDNNEYKVRNRNAEKGSSNINKIYSKFSEEVDILGYKGFKLTKSVLKGSEIISYYIQIDELDQLAQNSDFLNDFIIIRDNYLFAFADFKTGKEDINRIVDVKVEWKDDFSKSVDEKLKLLKDLKP